MARLSDTEREQFRQVRVAVPQPSRPMPVKPADYVAFATFFSRFAAPAIRKPITGGNRWKL